MTANATALSGAFPGNARQTDSYVITIANQKGGVGKTMITLSLAAHTAAAYGRALVVDVDPQASAYDLTQLMQDPGYDVVHELDPAQLTGLCVPKTSSTSCDQAVLVDQASGAGLPSDAVPVEINRFG